MAAGRFELPVFVMRAFCALVWLLLLQHGGGVNGERELSAVARRHLHSRLAAHRGTVRSIQSPDGDIVDCVLRHHQPALEHPLLTNHIIQEFPSSIPTNGHTTRETQYPTSSYKVLQVWHQNERCPFDTIPILRRDPSQPRHKKHAHYPMRNKYPHKVSNTSQDRSLIDASQNHEYAIVNYEPANTPIYGAASTLNLWNPSVELGDEFSLSQIWIIAGEYGGTDLNTIEVGWQVSPNFYQDTQPRLFIYWTADQYTTTGCYDLRCSGFVQVDNTIVLGGALNLAASTYKGDQVELPEILVWMDRETQNWWLSYGTNMLGYWPKDIFTHLAISADKVQWGGEIVNLSPGGFHTSTQMGSGHFANEGYQGACYTRSLAWIDSTSTRWNISLQDLTTFTTNPSCYDIQLTSFTNWATSFFFGGPGKNSNCP